MRDLAVRGLAILIGIAVLVGIALVAWGPVSQVSMFVVFLLDVVTSGDKVPVLAPVLWALWGAAIGTAVGMWMVAPSNGNGRQRPLILAAPFVVMLVVSALAHV